jgi:formylglycine-generating enzyme required for sulfatase activity
MRKFVKKATENIVAVAVSALTMTSCNIVRNDDDSDFWEDNNSYKGAIEMVKIEGGTFTMGCTDDECYDWELPTHKVTLSDFYIGKYEVTQKEWQDVMGKSLLQIANEKGWSNYTFGVGDNYPMYFVSWDDIVGTSNSSEVIVINGIRYYSNGFIYKLNQKTGKKYRLPTEAEWEYTARGGASSKGYKYSGSNTVGNVAWYWDNSGSKTHQVGTKQANELSIYDMSGNVWEWCADWYGSYSSTAQTNPTGPSTGYARVIRGGSWKYGARNACVSDRISSYGFYDPNGNHAYIGFRLACSP